jgi:hypothetical protein
MSTFDIDDNHNVSIDLLKDCVLITSADFCNCEHVVLSLTVKQSRAIAAELNGFALVLEQRLYLRQGGIIEQHI